MEHAVFWVDVVAGDVQKTSYAGFVGIPLGPTSTLLHVSDHLLEYQDDDASRLAMYFWASQVILICCDLCAVLAWKLSLRRCAAQPPYLLIA